MNTLFDVGCSIVDIRLIQNELFVACSDGSLQCYHAKGRKLWTIKFSQKICALTCIDVRYWKCFPWVTPYHIDVN